MGFLENKVEWEFVVQTVAWIAPKVWKKFSRMAPGEVLDRTLFHHHCGQVKKIKSFKSLLLLVELDKLFF